MFKTIFISLLSCVSLTLSAQTQYTANELTKLYKSRSHSRVSVHDPSIYYDPVGKQYHLQGTHLASAVSSDLVNWSYGPLQFGTQNAKGIVSVVDFTQAFYTNMTKSVRRTLNGKTETIPFGNFDAAEWRSAYGEGLPGNVWAPDVIYNKDLRKWCYYVALNGTWGQSDCVIVMCSSDSPTGPFVYQGPVVYSGFKNSTDPVVSWKKTDLEVVLGTLERLPPRYELGDSWAGTWPNCIDPTVFYDEEGEMWMCYGSFFGGIYMLKLDNSTGLRDYTYTYPSDYDTRGASCTVDTYFGYKIAGGNGVSGEGAYIQHFGKYYYLFITYGALDIYNGYEMRIFRSEKPYGPYYDYEGQPSTYDYYVVNSGGWDAVQRGDKLLGAYNEWGFQTMGEIAQGHCSSFIDPKKRYFVFYHTRFNDGEGGIHEVRVHQLFLNQNDMLVAAPFEFDGETLIQDSIESGCQFTKDDIPGEYHLLIHRYLLNNTIPEDVHPIKVTLEKNGKVTGDRTGSWKLTEGTSHFTINLGGTAYKGVLIEQMVDQTTLKAIAFTTVSNHGEPVWGYRLEDEYAVAYNYKNLTMPVKNGQTVSSNLLLNIETSENTTLTWTSSRPDIISNDGQLIPPDSDVSICLTARLQCGNAYWEESYDVTAKGQSMPTEDFLSQIEAMYNFDTGLLSKNLCQPSQYATRSSQSKGQKPSVEENPERTSDVLRLYDGTLDGNSSSFARIVNPLNGKTATDGFTVSVWVKRLDDDAKGTLWGFWNEKTITGDGARLFLTGNNYLEFNDNNLSWFRFNAPSSGTYTDIPVGKWSLVTYVVSLDDGVNVYINGIKRAKHAFESSVGNKPVSFDYQQIIDFVTNCSYFYLGAGGYEGSASALFDDLIIYSRALTTAEVNSLKQAENRVFDWENAVDIRAIDVEPNATFNGIYNLAGQRIDDNHRGLVIRNGKKIFVK